MEDAYLATKLSDALFALETLVEHVNALDRLPRQFHRDDWTAAELMQSAAEWREYCAQSQRHIRTD